MNQALLQTVLFSSALLRRTIANHFDGARTLPPPYRTSLERNDYKQVQAGP